MVRGFVQIARKAAIILMIGALCLPCSIKREIKQALDIPVMALDGTSRTSQAVSCLSLTTDAVPGKTSASPSKKKHPTYAHGYLLAIDHPVEARHRDLSVARNRTSSALPIYILHRQYRI